MMLGRQVCRPLLPRQTLSQRKSLCRCACLGGWGRLQAVALLLKLLLQLICKETMQVGQGGLLCRVQLHTRFGCKRGLRRLKPRVHPIRHRLS